MNSNNRLLSLDILRGLTVALMILVNNGAGHDHFYQLTHSKWNGLTCCDLVFPFFLFMVGVSIWFSLGGKTYTPTLRNKVLKRSAKMFLIGVLLHVWDMWIGGKDDILANLRIWGVLERIALCYCIVSLLVLWLNGKNPDTTKQSKSTQSFQENKKQAIITDRTLNSTFPSAKWLGIAIILLIVYSVILLAGNGYAQDESNIACIIDRALFGTAHLYHKSPIDPEGLLGTLPAIAHTLIGVAIGQTIREHKPLMDRIIQILSIAISLLILGYLLSLWLPLNKRIWSPTYVLVTCGYASLLLAILTIIVDVKGKQGWCRPFQWFGLNAIVLYVVSEMLAPVMGHSGISDIVYNKFLSCGLAAEWASLGYALSFVLLMTLLASLLYWRKIFIKL